MSQEDINRDLNGYLTERKSSKFWNRFKNRPKPKILVQEELKKDLEKQATIENIAPEDRHELEAMEEKIEEVNKVEIQVEEDIETEHESLMKKFFKKLHLSRTHDSDDMAKEDVATEISGASVEAASEGIQSMASSTTASMERHEEHESETYEHNDQHARLSPDEEELREVVHGLNAWISKLSPERLVEFKESEDYLLYTNYLRKHNLIK